MTAHEPDPIDVVVIGGGAAGLAAALVLGRARRSVAVIDAGDPRNAVAAHVHGYLGREGTPPAELLAIGREEIGRYGVAVRDDRVVSVEQLADGGFRVLLAGGDTVQARRLLLATGLRDELPPIPGLADRWGRDVVHCPYCHGWEVRDQPIVVIATGPAGVHQALMFRQWSGDVTLVVHAGSAPTHVERERFSARGIAVVEQSVAEVVTRDDRLVGVRLADGTVVPARAVVVAPTVSPRVEAVASLALEVVDAPMGFGSVLAADPSGATAVPGVFVAGNVADVRANVLAAAASGSLVAATVNADLVEADTAGARPVMDEAFWEARYRASPKVWSGNPNRHLVTEAAILAPGRALDAGAGEGADAVWLAEQGWEVVAVDLSQVALDRGRRHADERGLGDRIAWQQADLTTWTPPREAFDLVSAQYLHPHPDRRDAVHAALADAVAPGGTLLLVGHHPLDMDAGIGRPRWPEMFTTAESLAASLGDGWSIVAADTRAQQVSTHDGAPATAHDAVLVARRAISTASSDALHDHLLGDRHAGGRDHHDDD